MGCWTTLGEHWSAPRHRRRAEARLKFDLRVDSVGSGLGPDFDPMPCRRSPEHGQFHPRPGPTGSTARNQREGVGAVPPGARQARENNSCSEMESEVPHRDLLPFWRNPEHGGQPHAPGLAGRPSRRHARVSQRSRCLPHHGPRTAPYGHGELRECRKQPSNLWEREDHYPVSPSIRSGCDLSVSCGVLIIRMRTQQCPDLRENRSGHRGGGGNRTRVLRLLSRSSPSAAGVGLSGSVPLPAAASFRIRLSFP